MAQDEYQGKTKKTPGLEQAQADRRRLMLPLALAGVVILSTAGGLFIPAPYRWLAWLLAGALAMAMLVSIIWPYVQRKPVAPFQAQNRRIDAAMPSHTQVEQQVLLVVQVRFPDSPLLGLEDWPQKRKPDALEQADETTPLVFPVDPETGELRSTYVDVQVDTAHFEVIGDDRKKIEIPPDRYSQRLSFPMMAIATGRCCVTVTVYSTEQVCLGTIPVEIEALGLEQGGVGTAGVNIATLNLNVTVDHSSHVSTTHIDGNVVDSNVVTATGDARVEKSIAVEPEGEYIVEEELMGLRLDTYVEGAVHIDDVIIGREVIAELASESPVPTSSGEQIVLGGLFDPVRAKIASRPGESDVDQQEMVALVNQIEREAAQGEQADPQKIERWLRTLGRLARNVMETIASALLFAEQVSAGVREVAREALFLKDE